MFSKIKFPWFSRNGILVYPVSLPGLILTIATLAYIVYSFIDIDSRSHSASDTLRPFIIRCVIIYVIYFLIGAATGSFTRNPERNG